MRHLFTPEKQTIDIEMREARGSCKVKSMLLSTPIFAARDGSLFVKWRGGVHRIFIDAAGSLYTLVDGLTKSEVSPVVRHCSYYVDFEEKDICVVARDYGVYVLCKSGEDFFFALLDYMSNVCKFAVDLWDKNDVFIVGDYDWYIRLPVGVDTSALLRKIEKGRPRIQKELQLQVDERTEKLKLDLDIASAKISGLQAEVKYLSEANKAEGRIVIQSDGVILPETAVSQSESTNSQFEPEILEANKEPTSARKHETESSTGVLGLKKSHHARQVAMLLYYGFPNLIFPPAVVTALIRIEDLKAVLSVFERLNGKEPVRLKKLIGLSGASPLSEVDDHVATGKDRMARIYVRNNAHIGKLEIFLHLKKDNKEQQRFLENCTRMQLFEGREIVLK